MAYVTPLEYVQHFGLEETSELATPKRSEAVDNELLYLTITDGDRSSYTPEEIEVADETLNVIVTCIDSASKEMDGYIGAVYILPLSSFIITNNPIQQACLDISRYRIADTHPLEEIIARYKDWISWLDKVASNKIKLVTDDDGTSDSKKPTMSIKQVQYGINLEGY